MRAGAIGLAAGSVLALTACAGPPTGPATEGPPEEVATYLQRANACRYWRGEDATDPERGDYVRERRSDACSGLAARRTELRKRFADRAEVLELLSDPAP